MGIVVTDTNLNPIIQMSTWLLLALTSLMFCFRLLSRFFLRSNKLLSVEECLAFSAYVSPFFNTGLIRAGTVELTCLP